MDKDTSIRPEFSPREIVTHVTDEAATGVIVAFMMRGSTHSYEVQWGVEKCTWHLDYELRKKSEDQKQIGFWSCGPTTNEPEYQKHDYWNAGEKDCPADIKASNGELHTLRCKRCGRTSPRSPICLP